MKTIKHISLAFIAISFMYNDSLHAQTDATSPAVSSAYIELGGPSVIFAFNYDRRFSNSHPDGWGFRVGIGGYSVGDDNWLYTAPVLINYLYGNDGNYFEAGIGAVAGDGNEDILFLREESIPVAGCLYFGFRNQPEEGGLVFRAGIPFLFGQYTQTSYWWYDDGLYPPYKEKVNFITPWVPAISLGLAW